MWIRILPFERLWIWIIAIKKRMRAFPFKKKTDSDPSLEKNCGSGFFIRLERDPNH